MRVKMRVKYDISRYLKTGIWDVESMKRIQQNSKKKVTKFSFLIISEQVFSTFFVVAPRFLRSLKET